MTDNMFNRYRSLGCAYMDIVQQRCSYTELAVRSLCRAARSLIHSLLRRYSLAYTSEARQGVRLRPNRSLPL